MRLGLIGTGKQGQRYLLEKNGGRHIVRSGSRRIPLDGLDGVIIATHPAGHKELALECIAAGKAVLIEKPLALNLADCEIIIDAAEKAGVGFLVAHLDCWAAPWLGRGGPSVEPYSVITYQKHDRDYSPWLDWAPHGLALLDKVGGCDARNIVLSRTDAEHAWGVRLFSSGRQIYERRPCIVSATPMALAVRDLTYRRREYDHNRRVYRALFAEE